VIEPIYFIWQEVLYRPIYNLFIFVYNFTPGPNVGWAVISLAILIRVLFLNSTFRGFRTDAVIEDIEPYLEKIEEEEKHDPKEKRRRITELLKGKDINLYHEFYVIFAQVVFLIVLYSVFQYGFSKEGMRELYSWVKVPSSIHSNFFGFDLAHPNALLSLVASLTLFIQLVWEYNSKLNIVRIRFSEKWFPLLLAIFTYILLVILPSAKALFILVSVLFSILLKVIIVVSKATGSQNQSLPEVKSV